LFSLPQDRTTFVNILAALSKEQKGETRMKNNRRNWIVVVIVVIATIVNVLGSLRNNNSQQSSSKTIQLQKTPPREKPSQAEFEARFPVADYDELKPDNLEEHQKRKEKGKRYDNKNLVVRNPRLGIIKSELVNERPIPPAIPVAESDAIVIGEVQTAKGFLSNDKRGVYSEFDIQVDKVLKNNHVHKIVTGSSVIADREGGFVRYPDGQKLLYTVSLKGMPPIEGRVVLFLTKPDESRNYYILTGYEIKEGKIYPLDGGLGFQKFTGMSEDVFIATIREALEPSPQKVEKKEGNHEKQN
jgi:hypothetical protein